MRFSKNLATIVALGALALGGCGKERELEEPTQGKLDSGLRYVTYTRKFTKNHDERVIYFGDGVAINLIEHDGKATLAGDYLQGYDISKDGKYVLLDEEFNHRTTDQLENREHWKKIAIGDSKARAETIDRINEFYQQRGSQRKVYEGSPDIESAVKRAKNKQNK